MIVADTNLIVYAMTPDPNLELAQAVLHKDPDWHAPLLWRSEFRNAMAGYMRSGVFTLDQVLSTFRQAEDLMDGQEHEIDAADVMRLVSESTCSAYDCEFVALAQQLDVSLVTTDRRILREFPNVAVAPVEFVG